MEIWQNWLRYIVSSYWYLFILRYSADNTGIFFFFFFLGGGAGSGITKKCDHACDQALKKKQLGICIEYTYISELMLWLHWGKFVIVKWVKTPSLAVLQVDKYMRTKK